MTASDLAALCEVDLKTIHNWVERGRIAHFRTPGRHLRFRAADVAEFLRAWGYAVPRELARASSRAAIFVGPKEALPNVQRALGEGMQVRNAVHPYDALVFAGAEPADVFVVDVRALPEEVEANAFLDALHRAAGQATFLAFADEGQELPSFVARVSRNDPQALSELVPSGAPAASGTEDRGLAAGGSR